MPPGTTADDVEETDWQDEYSRRDQGWIHDKFIAEGGLDAFFPEATPWMIQKGLQLADLKRAFDNAKNGRMGIDTLVRVADHHAETARQKERQGKTHSATEYYHRAAVAYIKAQWSILDDESPDKLDWHGRGVSCYEKVIELTPHYDLERVDIDLPFADEPMSAIFHKSGETGAPTILYSPGMDMSKEEYPNPLGNRFIDRGLNVLAIDGPGQGETRLRGICDDEYDKYQRAGSAALDWLVDRPEVDPERIGVFGISMGTYWGPKIAIADDRVGALGLFMGAWYNRDAGFEQDQPFFKKRFMYMAGMFDEDEFDDYYPGMTLSGIEEEIDVPTFIAHGEYDQLQPREDAKRFFERITGPKHLQLYHNEFHPVGNCAVDLLCDTTDWFIDVFDGEIDDDYAHAELMTDYPRDDYIPSPQFDFLEQGDRPG